jgi:hypothetical protein
MAESFPSSATAPLVIGATGGSGTRVLAKIAQRVGYFFGTNLNQPQDALEFLGYHDKWINRYIRKDAPLSPEETEEMRQDLSATLVRHLGENLHRVTEPGFRWGWKAPRSIYFLPFFHAQFPALKYIHVLRDGRDMAFSKNQNQLRKNGKAILTLKERWLLPLPVRSLLLWDRVNLKAADFGETVLGENYLSIRFEDLCQEPVKTVERILRFLNVDADAEELARSEISPPSSIGRWRSQSPEMIARLEKVGERSLRRFGYLR